MMNLTDIQYKQLTAYIKYNIGIDLDDSKKFMVMGRLKALCAKKKITNYDDLYKLITIDKDEDVITMLHDAITTNYTYFMREVEHFNFLQKTVLPEIKKTSRTKDLRVWCAGCSTGEEAYTLAMIIDMVLAEEKGSWDRKLLATDLSTEVLEKCVAGVYTNTSLKSMPPDWVNRYFKPLNAMNSEVKPEIKQQIIFRRFNLMTEQFPFKKKFNVIFCRNVMIYFDFETRTKLLNKYYDLLEPGGYLFIGHSESIEKNITKFKYVMPAVYKKE